MIKRLFIILFLLLCVPVFAERKLTTNEAVKLAIGPFFDSTDGITPETGIDVTGLTVEIYREFDADTTPTRFANFVPTASGGSNDMVLIGSSVSGLYSLEVTAAQLNFTGAMILTIVDTDSAGIVGLPFWRYFTLSSANVVDAEYGTDKLQVDQVELGSSTQSTTDLKDFADAGYDPANDKVTGVLLTDTTTAVSNTLDVNVASEDNIDFGAAKKTSLNTAADTVTVTSIGNDIITAASIATNAIGALELADAIEPLTAAETEAEAVDALESFKLDELMAEGVTTSLQTAVHDNSVIGYMLTSVNVSAYVRTEDSLEDIRDRGDATWVTATSVDLENDAITAAKITDAAWQELIELMFTFDATATYGTQGGSVVDQIADNAGVATALNTTVGIGDTSTSFTLTAGTPVAIAYPDMQITVTDGDGNTSTETRRISTYTSGRIVTVDTAFSFTPAAGDVAVIERAYLGVSVSGGDATEAKQDIIITAVKTNAAGVDIAADIIALRTVANTIATDTDAYDSDAEYAAAIWNALTVSYGTAGTYGLLAEEMDVVIDTINADVGDNGIDIASVLADTQDLQTNQGNWLTATGFAVSGEPLTAQEVEDTVWDAVITKVNRNVANSAGKKLRQVEFVSVLREEEQAQGGSASTITLHTDASSITGFYDDAQVIIIGDTGIGQSRHIHAYVGSTRVASITPDWITNPDATSDYVIMADSEKHVHEIDTDAINAATTSADYLAEINEEVDIALNTAIPGSPTANSINERIKALDDAYTATRAGYLDQLNTGGTLFDNITAIKAYWDSLTIIDGLLEVVHGNI